ncbi:MAG TPA: hypothetical protein VKF59_08960 [Candidatus Dormibacteraeota bacterium]|nr:hypothetical protein [Candidatus Dormibacteraeota bacterium]
MWEIASEHVPGLAGGLVAALAWLLAARLLPVRRFREGYAAAPGSVRLAALLMAVTAGVHLALAPHVLDESPLTALAFVADALAFVALAVAAFTAWWWRRAAATLVVATIGAYLVYVAVGLEAPDQVGTATALVELTALGLALVPVPGEARPGHRELRWAAVAVAVPALTMLTGLTVWGADLLRPGAGHQHAGAVVQATAAVPTPQQRAQADRLFSETAAAIAPYRDWRVAWAAGYRPSGPASGAVHWMNAAYARGPILDPRRPQGLVYVRGRSGWVLAGAMFEMPRLGEFGPDPGGPLTAWHQHQDVCVSPLGPAISLATPYASCPLGAVGMSFPAMLHVWIVGNPAGGRFAIDLDPRTVRALERS